LQESFPSRLISRFGDVDSPPRFPYLTTPDYFLWGYLKDGMYDIHSTTITQLKLNICAQVAMISNDLCGNVMAFYYFFTTSEKIKVVKLLLEHPLESIYVAPLLESLAKCSIFL